MTIEAYGFSRSVSIGPRRQCDGFADTSLVADGQEIIPYTVWGNNVKISIRVPTELRFHDLTYDSKPIAVAQTSWVNYCFDDESGERFWCYYTSNRMLIASRVNTLSERSDGQVPDLERQNIEDHAPT